jgi:hypothetical protein
MKTKSTNFLAAALSLALAVPAGANDWHNDRDFEHHDRDEWRPPPMRYDRHSHLRDECPSFEYYGTCPEDNER